MEIKEVYVDLDDEVKAIEGNPHRYYQHCMSLYHKMNEDKYLHVAESLEFLLDNLDKPGKVMTSPECPLTQKGYTKLLVMLEGLKQPYQIYKDKLSDIYQMFDYMFLTAVKNMEQNKEYEENSENEEGSKKDVLLKRLSKLAKTFELLTDAEFIPDSVKDKAKELHEEVVKDINKKIDEENKNEN